MSANTTQTHSTSRGRTSTRESDPYQTPWAFYFFASMLALALILVVVLMFV